MSVRRGADYETNLAPRTHEQTGTTSVPRERIVNFVKGKDRDRTFASIR